MPCTLKTLNIYKKGTDKWWPTVLQNNPLKTISRSIRIDFTFYAIGLLEHEYTTFINLDLEQAQQPVFINSGEEIHLLHQIISHFSIKERQVAYVPLSGIKKLKVKPQSLTWILIISAKAYTVL